MLYHLDSSNDKIAFLASDTSVTESILWMTSLLVESQ